MVTGGVDEEALVLSALRSMPDRPFTRPSTGCISLPTGRGAEGPPEGQRKRPRGLQSSTIEPGPALCGPAWGLEAVRLYHERVKQALLERAKGRARAEEGLPAPEEAGPTEGAEGGPGPLGVRWEGLAGLEGAVQAPADAGCLDQVILSALSGSGSPSQTMGPHEKEVFRAAAEARTWAEASLLVEGIADWMGSNPEQEMDEASWENVVHGVVADCMRRHVAPIRAPGSTANDNLARNRVWNLLCATLCSMHPARRASYTAVARKRHRRESAIRALLGRAREGTGEPP